MRITEDIALNRPRGFSRIDRIVRGGVGRFGAGGREFAAWMDRHQQLDEVSGVAM